MERLKSLVVIICSLFICLLFHINAYSNQFITIDNIQYKYELCHNDNGNYDCCGELYGNITLPENTKTMIFENTVRPFREETQIHFLQKTQIPLEYPVTKFCITNFKWNNYFKISMVLNDDTRIDTPIYSINDYIDETDLKLLSISAPSVDAPTFLIKNNTIHIETSEITKISVFDITGALLLNYETNYNTDIALDKFLNTVIIIRIEQSHFSKTTKIYLK